MAKNVFKNHTDKVLRTVVLKHIDSDEIAVEEACRILANKVAPDELKPEDYVEGVYVEEPLDLEIEGENVAELVRNFKKAIEVVLPDSGNNVRGFGISLELSGYDGADNRLSFYEDVPLTEGERSRVDKYNSEIRELYSNRDLISAEYHQHKSKRADEEETKRKSKIEAQIAALQAQL